MIIPLDIMSTNTTCTECGNHGPIDGRGNTEQKLYMSDACKKGHTCCSKFLCVGPCKLNIECDQCGHINLFERKALPSDLGWNYLECKTTVTIVCECGNRINHSLHWNHNCSSD